MKKILAVSLATIAIGALSASTAKAGVNFGLSIGISAPPVYVAPAPVYAAPAPVYVAPAPAPVYVAPAPVCVPPRVVYEAPAVVVRPTFGFYGYSHGGHPWAHHRHYGW